MSAQQVAHAEATSANALNVPKRKACDNCKRRKVRCTGDRPCPNCVRHGVSCDYNAAHGKLAHSQRQVAHLQRQLYLMQAAWKRHLPDVDMSTATNTVADGAELHANSVQEAGRTPEVSTSPPSVDTKTVKDHDNDTEGTISSPDSEYEEVDTLNWDESQETAIATDGIGSLSIRWKGIGYMGPQTGNTLLRKLHSISVLYMMPEDDAELHQSPQPEVPEAILRSPQFASQCIESYFRYYHCVYPLLHEGSFRAQMMGALPKPKDGSWPILYNTVLALGALSGELCDQNADIHFYRDASKHLSWDKLQRGTLSLVQAFALLSNYLQKRNRPNSSFTLLGIAINMAQGIGLHRELAGVAVSAFSMEIRRRVWWTLFNLDAGLRLTFGRPTLTLGGINTRLPKNLNDSDLSVDMDELPPSRDVPTTTSSLIWQAKLARIGNKANERLVAKHVPHRATMMSIGKEIDVWHESLPVYIRADYNNLGYELYEIPRLILHWRSMHLQINVYRPYLLELIRKREGLYFDDQSTASVRCYLAADICISSILKLLSQTITHYGLLSWYVCYWLITAIFIHITCLLYDPQHQLAAHWRLQIDNAKETLKRVGTFEPMGLRAAQIIEKIINLVPSTPDSDLFTTNEPIRMEVAEMWNQSWADMEMPQEPFAPRWLTSDMPNRQY